MRVFTKNNVIQFFVIGIVFLFGHYVLLRETIFEAASQLTQKELGSVSASLFIQERSALGDVWFFFIVLSTTNFFSSHVKALESNRLRWLVETRIGSREYHKLVFRKIFQYYLLFAIAIEVSSLIGVLIALIQATGLVGMRLLLINESTIILQHIARSAIGISTYAVFMISLRRVITNNYVFRGFSFVFYMLLTLAGASLFMVLFGYPAHQDVSGVSVLFSVLVLHPDYLLSPGTLVVFHVSSPIIPFVSVVILYWILAWTIETKYNHGKSL